MYTVYECLLLKKTKKTELILDLKFIVSHCLEFWLSNCEPVSENVCKACSPVWSHAMLLDKRSKFHGIQERRKREEVQMKDNSSCCFSHGKWIERGDTCFLVCFFNDCILQKIINGHSLDPSINTRLQKKVAVVSNGWQKQWVLKRTVAGGVSCLFGCCQHVVQQWRLMTSAQGKTQTSSDDITCTCFRQMSLHVGGSWADSWKMIFASLAGAPPVIWFLGKQISLLANSCQCCKLKRLFGGTLTYTFKLVHDKTLSIHPFTYPHTPEPIPAVFGQ